MTLRPTRTERTRRQYRCSMPTTDRTGAISRSRRPTTQTAEVGLEPFRSKEIHTVVESVGGRPAIDGLDHRLGKLELEEEVVRDAHLHPYARPGQPAVPPLAGLGIQQGGATVVDEDEELENLPPLLPEEGGDVGEAGRIPAELASDGIAVVARDLGHGVAAHGAMSAHDELLGGHEPRARPLPGRLEENRGRGRDLLQPGDITG